MLATLFAAALTTSAIGQPVAPRAVPLHTDTPDVEFRAAAPTSSAFTYQGRLDAGGFPADGSFDFEFVLTDAMGGTVAGPICLDDIPVSDGLFTVVLDFGGVFSGDERSLALSVRAGGDGSCGSGGPFTPLVAPQVLTPTPYASGLVLPFLGQTEAGPFGFEVRQSGAAAPSSAALYGVSDAEVATPGAVRVGVRGDAGASSSSFVPIGVLGLAGDGGFGMVGFTDADSTTAILGQTDGDASNAILAFANGAESRGLEALTQGEQSFAIVASSFGAFSTGVLAQAVGSDSFAVRAVTSGPDSIALDARASGVDSVAGRFDGGLETDRIRVIDGAAPGAVLTSDADGNATWEPAGPEIGTGFGSGVTASVSGSLTFLSPTVTLTVSDGDRVFVAGTVTLGAFGAGGADGLELVIARRFAAGGPISPVAASINSIQVSGGTRVPMALNAIVTGLIPGTYEFGVAGRDGSNANAWNLRSASYVSAIVLP